MSDHEAKQAMPHATLLVELLDSRTPKSEREHAAKQEIARLTAERDEHAHWRRDLADKLHYRETDIIELRRQLAEAEQDARRYRWLRENAVSYPDHEHELELVVPMRFADAWRDDSDAAIDAAMGLTRPAEES